MNNPFEDLYRPDTDDAELLKSLGLIHDIVMPHAEKVNLGTVKVDGGTIEVSATAWPSIFWEFRIRTSESKDYVMRTGTLRFSEVWPIAKMLCDDMIEIKKVV